MQAIEFLQGLGWFCIAVYCLNNLGLVPTSWIDAAQSRAGIPQSEVVGSPSASPSAVPVSSPTPSATPTGGAIDAQQ